MTPKQKLAEILEGMLQHYKARWDRLTEDFDEALPDLDKIEAQQALSNWFIETLDEVLNTTTKEYIYVKGDTDIETVDNIRTVDEICDIREEFRQEAKANALKILGVSNE